MLTDDEQIVIDSLKFIIDKNFPGQVEFYEAKTGGDAVNICRSHKIDIAFVDINMPGLNGLDAIKEIKQFTPDILIIILSAFDRFQYARDALDFGVYRYLTKPVNRNVIAQTVRNAMSVVDETKGRLSSDIELREKLSSVSSIVENDFIYSSIFSTGEQKNLASYLDFFNIKSKSYFFCTTEIPHISTQNRYDVYMQFREIMSSSFECIIGPLMLNRIVVYFPFEQTDNKITDEERISVAVRNIFSLLSMRIGSDIRIGVSAAESDLDNTITIYNQTLRTLNTSTAPGVYFWKDEETHSKSNSSLTNYSQRIIQRITQGDMQELHHLFKSYCSSLFNDYPNELTFIKNKFFILLVFARDIAHEAKNSYAGNDSEDDTFKTLLDLNTQVDLEQYVFSQLCECTQIISESKSAKSNPVIEKAYSFINNNLSSTISLEDTAKFVNVSPFYLSKLFKDETDENFIDYLTKARIKKAKELLKEGSLSIKEISHETGYNDQNYFSKLFKKNTGYTPTEFKDSLLSGGIV